MPLEQGFGSSQACFWSVSPSSQPCDCESVQGVNAVAEVSMGDPNQPLGKLIKVLNNQLQALTHLDARTDQLAAKVDAVTSSGIPFLL